MNDKKRQLLWHGMLLFLLGLLMGFVEQKFTNTRMGLAAFMTVGIAIVIASILLLISLRKNAVA